MSQNIIVMLGDSLTAGNDWSRAFPNLNIKNLGIDGDTAAGVWNRLDEVVALKPAKIFLMIGTNDFLSGAVQSDLLIGHERIWKELKDKLPETQLFVQSIPPYLEAALPGLYPNLDLLLINRCLGEEAEKNGLTYINLFDDLADEGYQLCLEYTSDGVHLTQEGYTVWENRLKSYL